MCFPVNTFSIGYDGPYRNIYSWQFYSPDGHIVQLGDPKKLKHHLIMMSTEKCQLRHNAMEACRQYINKKIDKEFSGNYLFKIIPYPHHVQRENKMLTGAGADRMQTGMQLAFGKSAGKAAILKKGSKIFHVILEINQCSSFIPQPSNMYMIPKPYHRV